ncbi:MAG: ADP-ribosylglycohydrolase family protein [Bifidobacterium sp.]|nr:ADP-ribosylglycohydrolase family protein [Bifidobacterium sp.]
MTESYDPTSRRVSDLFNADGHDLDTDQAHAYIHYSLDLLYGAAVGNVLGQPYDGKLRGTFTCTGMGTPPDQRAYDARIALMLATFDSLTSNNTVVNLPDMRNRYAMCLAGGDYTPDLKAPAGADALSATFDAQDPVADIAALVRVAPCALFDIGDDDVRAIAGLAPADEGTLEACVTYVHILRDLLLGNPIRETLTGHGFDRVWDKPMEHLDTAGDTAHDLEAAMWCLATTDAYDDCALTAVNLGGRASRTAAVAGAAAALVYEFAEGLDEGIPTEWMTMPGAQWFPEVISGTSNDESEPEEMMREGDKCREGVDGEGPDYALALEYYRNAVSLLFSTRDASDPDAVLLVAELHERIGDAHEHLGKAMVKSAFMKNTHQNEREAFDNYRTAVQAAEDALKLGLDARGARRMQAILASD